MVDITNLANMFSQKTGAQSSMATMVINAVIGYMMQRSWWNDVRWRYSVSFIKLHGW